MGRSGPTAIIILLTIAITATTAGQLQLCSKRRSFEHARRRYPRRLRCPVERAERIGDVARNVAAAARLGTEPLVDRLAGAPQDVCLAIVPIARLTIAPVIARLGTADVIISRLNVARGTRQKMTETMLHRSLRCTVGLLRKSAL